MFKQMAKSVRLFIISFLSRANQRSWCRSICYKYSQMSAKINRANICIWWVFWNNFHKTNGVKQSFNGIRGKDLLKSIFSTYFKSETPVIFDGRVSLTLSSIGHGLNMFAPHTICVAWLLSFCALVSPAPKWFRLCLI